MASISDFITYIGKRLIISSGDLACGYFSNKYMRQEFKESMLGMGWKRFVDAVLAFQGL